MGSMTYVLMNDSIGSLSPSILNKCRTKKSARKLMNV